jgi:hypothetical protein
MGASFFHRLSPVKMEVLFIIRMLLQMLRKQQSYHIQPQISVVEHLRAILLDALIILRPEVNEQRRIYPPNCDIDEVIPDHETAIPIRENRKIRGMMATHSKVAQPHERLWPTGSEKHICSFHYISRKRQTGREKHIYGFHYISKKRQTGREKHIYGFHYISKKRQAGSEKHIYSFHYISKKLPTGREETSRLAINHGRYKLGFTISATIFFHTSSNMSISTVIG